MYALGLALVAFASSAAALTVVNPPYGQLAVNGKQLVGSNGQAVQLRGMSLFWSQWMGQYFSADVVKALKCQWNSNVVRAAMAVDQGGYASNPSGEYQKIKTVIEAAISNGIYVIADFHIHEAQNYKSQALAFFKQVAKDYGKYPHVLYELWNEPLQVDWNSVIKPFHTEVLKAIRAIDPDNVALLGTPAWSGASGIQAASNSPLSGQKNIMYVQHFYSGSHGSGERSAMTQAAGKIPVFISEYGISQADGGGNQQIYTAEADAWFKEMDRLKISYVNWAIDDKSESSAALKPGTQPSQVGNANQWSNGGKYIQKMLKSKNNGVKC
ncbi:beta-1,4-endoglucanase [Aphelenchoides avenae]|nr:beta-1,4-endoglucanase [Aphelenchus avenae]